MLPIFPTEYGNFRINVFTSEKDDREQVAIVHGEVFGVESVATRIHSECLTGDVMGSLRCDCRKQLELGLRQIATMPCGVLLYLRQEGRGSAWRTRSAPTGSRRKGSIPWTQTSPSGSATTNETTGSRWHAANAGREVVRIMTNNPDKVAQLRPLRPPGHGALAHAIPPGVHNRGYLETKARRSGHILDVSAPPPAVPMEPEVPVKGA